MSNEADMREALHLLRYATTVAERDSALVAADVALDALLAESAAAEAQGFARGLDAVSAFLHSNKARDFLGGYAPVDKDLNTMVRWLDRRIRAMTDGRVGGEACTCGAQDARRPETLQAAHYADCPWLARGTVAEVKP